MSANYKEAAQKVQLRRLIFGFVFRIQQMPFSVDIVHLECKLTDVNMSLFPVVYQTIIFSVATDQSSKN